MDIALEQPLPDVVVRTPIVPKLGLAVRVYQGNLEGAYGVISDIQDAGSYVMIERNGHEFGELTINLELS